MNAARGQAQAVRTLCQAGEALGQVRRSPLARARRQPPRGYTTVPICIEWALSLAAAGTAQPVAGGLRRNQGVSVDPEWLSRLSQSEIGSIERTLSRCLSRFGF